MDAPNLPVDIRNHEVLAVLHQNNVCKDYICEKMANLEF